MEMCLLDAFTMVALRVRETKESFLQKITVESLALQLLHITPRWNPLFLIPECKSNILQAMGIRDTSNTILSPTKGS